jgi:hypothetical protein
VLDDGACRSVVEPQHFLGAQASPSRTRSRDHGVTAQTLADDARTETPSPAVDSRMETPLPTADVRTATPPLGADATAQGPVGDIGASTPPPIIDVDPISATPTGADEDLVRDRAQIEQASKDSGTSSTQVANSTSSNPKLTRWEIA